jgi:hypothetical protein
LCGKIVGPGRSAAKQVPPQPGTIPALGLRARATAFSLSRRPALERRNTLLLSSWWVQRRQLCRNPQEFLQQLEAKSRRSALTAEFFLALLNRGGLTCLFLKRATARGERDMPRLKMAYFGILLGAALAGPAGGADFKMSLKADGIRMGDHVSGPQLTADDLKGKVVFVEFWGIR